MNWNTATISEVDSEIDKRLEHPYKGDGRFVADADYELPIEIEHIWLMMGKPGDYRVSIESIQCFQSSVTWYGIGETLALARSRAWLHYKDNPRVP